MEKMESNYLAETEIKKYLHAWLGQRRSMPSYDASNANDQFGFFNVTVKSTLAPSLIGTGRARSKKDAQTMAAWNYCEQLVKNGFMTAMPGMPFDEVSVVPVVKEEPQSPGPSVVKDEGTVGNPSAMISTEADYPQQQQQHQSPMISINDGYESSLGLDEHHHGGDWYYGEPSGTMAPTFHPVTQVRFAREEPSFANRPTELIATGEDEGGWDLENAGDYLDEFFKKNAIIVTNKYTPIGLDGERCIIAEMWFTVQGPDRAQTKMYAREEADTKRTANAKVSLNAIDQLRGMNLIGSYIEETMPPPPKKMCTVTHSDRPPQTRIIEQHRPAPPPPVLVPKIARVHQDGGYQQSYRHGFVNQDGNIAGRTSTAYEYSDIGRVVNYGGSNSTTRGRLTYPHVVSIARPPQPTSQPQPQPQPLVSSHSNQPQPRLAPRDPRTAALYYKRAHPN